MPSVYHRNNTLDNKFKPVSGCQIKSILGLFDSVRHLIRHRENVGTLEKELDAKAKVLVAEVQRQSWLQRNWRPLLMLVFTYIVAHNFVIAPIFRITSVPVPEQMWTLLNIGIGGYIVGRSVEKIATSIKKDDSK